MRAAMIGVVVAAMWPAMPASAEQLVVSLSAQRVSISSSFTGTELVLFGTIEHDSATVSRRGGYDIVTSVTGPRQSLVVLRKERVFGLWINTGSRDLAHVPHYLATLSTRPLSAVASDETLQRLRVGSSHALMALQDSIGAAYDRSSSDPYLAGLQRLKSRQRLYSEAAHGMTFLTPTLFRGAITLPAEAPVGTYEVEVRLFVDGVPIAHARSAFNVVKDGFEQFVESAARNHGLAYGLVTVAMALATGWLASIAFRRN